VANQTEHDAQDDAGCQWDVKRETAAPHPNISREPAQVEKRKKLRVRQQNAGYKQNNPQSNQQPPQTHNSSLVDLNRFANDDLRLTIEIIRYLPASPCRFQA
jgi:hypothetical protein